VAHSKVVATSARHAEAQFGIDEAAGAQSVVVQPGGMEVTDPPLLPEPDCMLAPALLPPGPPERPEFEEDGLGHDRDIVTVVVEAASTAGTALPSRHHT
jgi:hypothetical protein